MFECKDLDAGFCILCPDSNVRSLAATVRSIRNYSKAHCWAVVPKTTSKAIADEIKQHCDVVKGGATYSSLINVGVQKCKQDWCFIIFAGSIAKGRFWERYSRFVQDEKDILFPVVRLDDGINVSYRTNFVDGSLNGLLMHKNVLKVVGKLPELSDIEEVKLTWAFEAISSGYRFKGVLGSRLVG